MLQFSRYSNRKSYKKKYGVNNFKFEILLKGLSADNSNAHLTKEETQYILDNRNYPNVCTL